MANLLDWLRMPFRQRVRPVRRRTRHAIAVVRIASGDGLDTSLGGAPTFTPTLCQWERKFASPLSLGERARVRASACLSG